MAHEATLTELTATLKGLHCKVRRIDLLAPPAILVPCVKRQTMHGQTLVVFLYMNMHVFVQKYVHIFVSSL